MNKIVPKVSYNTKYIICLSLYIVSFRIICAVLFVSEHRPYDTMRAAPSSSSLICLLFSFPSLGGVSLIVISYKYICTSARRSGCEPCRLQDLVLSHLFFVLSSTIVSYTRRHENQVYHAAFKTSENLLVCAPTGAGKTNVAMLSLLQASPSRVDEKKNPVYMICLINKKNNPASYFTCIIKKKSRAIR